MFCSLLRVTALCCVISLLACSIASAEIGTFYGYEAGSITASGDVFDPEGFTAAVPYNTYPFGTILTVCYDGCVDVVVNDTTGCCTDIDLALGAARAIGLTEAGKDEVTVTPH